MEGKSEIPDLWRFVLNRATFTAHSDDEFDHSEFKREVEAAIRGVLDKFGVPPQRIVRISTVVRDEYGEDDEYPFQDWFTVEREENLKKIVPILADLPLREYSVLKHYWKDGDVQCLRVRYLAPVSPEDVEILGSREHRMDGVRQWANFERLNRVYFGYEKCDCGQERILLASGNLYMPQIYRTYTVPRDKLPKFTIIDGNNRFTFARDNNIPFVMCNVYENIEFTEDSELS